MRALNGLDIGSEICKILELDPKFVRSIVIEIYPDDVVYVKVGRILQREEFDEIKEKIQTYKLVKTDITDEIITR